MTSTVTSTIQSVRDKFDGIIKQKNAAAYVIDDVLNVSITRRQAATAAGGATPCTSEALRTAIKEAASDTLVNVVPFTVQAAERTKVFNNVADAILAVACRGNASTISKSNVVTNMRAYQAKDVTGYPVDATSGLVTFAYKVNNTAQRGTIAMAANNLDTSATIRVHSNGTISYRAAGTEKLHTVTVRSVANVQGQAGTYDLTFEKAEPAISKTFEVFKLTSQVAPKVGEQAQAFVNTADQKARVTQFVKWTGQVTSLTVTASKVTRLQDPPNTFEVQFEATPPPPNRLAPQRIKGLVFVGDVAKVNVVTNGGTTSVVGPIMWTDKTTTVTGVVESVTVAADKKSSTIVFKDSVTQKTFKPFVWVSPRVSKGDTATLYAHQANSTVHNIVKWLTRETMQPETLGPETSQPETLGPDTLGPDKPKDDATGNAVYETGSPGIRINVNLDNQNDNDDRGMGGLYYGGGVVGVVDTTETSAPEPTEAPATEEPDDMDDSGGSRVQTYSCPPAPACPKGLSNSGTFFCMTKRTFIIVIVMLLLASVLAGVGYYMYRKKWKMGGANAAAGAPANGFGGLGDLGGLGGPGGGGGGGSGANFGR